MLPDYDFDMANYDGEIRHAPLSEFFSEGDINWKKLKGHFGINIQWRNTKWLIRTEKQDKYSYKVDTHSLYCKGYCFCIQA